MAQPTILDVAARAGVSKSLVSLVMRDSPSVSEAKRRAVLAAVAELDYRPNAVARSLVQRRTGVLGVLLSDLHNTFFADVLDGIAGRAAERGYKAMLNTGNRAASGEADAIETLLELRADGLILTGPRLEAAQITEAARAVPVVLVARTIPGSAVDCVSNDDVAGAGLAVDHLVKLGHRRIAHIDGGAGAGAEARKQGYARTMRRHGLAAEARIARGDYTEEGGARGIKSLLARGPRPTAIFAANDLSAIGALDALTRRGLRVPEDISLVGYDNTSVAALRHIDLTTIDQPREAMGRTAVDLLLERLEPRHLTLHTREPPPERPGRRLTAPLPRLRA